MSIQSDNSIDLGQVLERSRLRSFLEETARFYECRIVLLGRDRAVIADVNGSAGGGPAGSLSECEVGEVFEVESAQLDSISAYGVTLGYVVAEPLRTADRRGAEALSEHFAQLLSELASKEYELNDLSREILDSYEEVNLFYEIAAALGRAEDVQGVCSLILEKACEIIKVSRASILLLDDKCGELFIAAARGMAEEEARSVRIPVGEGISGKVLESRVPRLVDDVCLLPTDLLAGYEQYATQSFISVPLVVDRRSRGTQGRAIGVINMTDKESEEKFTSGDLKLLTALANQAAVLIENFRLLDIEKELRIARRIQRSLLPVAPPEVPGVDIEGSCVPAHNVGGDYFDFVHKEEEGVLATVIADVSGHDIASALMMAVVRSALRSEIRRSREPGAVLREVNCALFEDLTRAELFLSVFCCSYEIGTRTLRYANAGHSPALLHRPADGSTRVLDAEGLLVGVLDDVPFVEGEVALEPGDVLLLHTDGLTETTGASGEMFGMDRLARELERAAGLGAEETLERIFEAVYEFGGQGVQTDDMTAVVLKVSPAATR